MQITETFLKELHARLSSSFINVEDKLMPVRLVKFSATSVFLFQGFEIAVGAVLRKDRKHYRVVYINTGTEKKMFSF